MPKSKAQKQKNKQQHDKAWSEAATAVERRIQALPKGNERVQLYLNVPYCDVPRAKNLGARWDAVKRLWYVPHGADVLPLQAWWPMDLKVGLGRVANKV